MESNVLLNTMHCDTLIDFLKTDLDGFASLVLSKRTDIKIDEFLKTILDQLRTRVHRKDISLT